MDANLKAFELATHTAVADNDTAASAQVVTIASPGARRCIVIVAYGFSANVAIPAGGADVTLAYTPRHTAAVTIHHRVPAGVTPGLAFSLGRGAKHCAPGTAVVLTVPAMAGVKGSAWIDYFIGTE